MRIGLVYYPEHWDESMWEADARLIREAGCDTVRLAEFTWVKMEPVENQYDFSWLDRVCQILYKNGIKAILCTPTATPPKWLMDKHPDIYMEDEYGHTRGFGSRRHYCYNSEVYQEYTEKIVTAMAKYFRDKPYVAAWQIDNEFGCGDGGMCYCENCRRAFIRWLKDRYVSLEDVNDHWGTIFWGQTYTEWNQIITPKLAAAAAHENSGHNPGFLIDYARFMSDSISDYCRLQYRILKKYYPEIPVTHNIVEEHYDYEGVKDYIDTASYDLTVFSPWRRKPFSEISYYQTLTRSIRNQNYWIVEHQCSQGGWDHYGDTLRPGTIKMLTWQSLALGCEWIIYWKLRAGRYGTEQYWIGVVDHDNVPRRRYYELQSVIAELPGIMKYSDGSRVKSDILLLRSYDQLLCHRYQRNNKDFDYSELLKSYYAAMFAENYNLDIGNEYADFSNYKLVLIPAYAMQKPEFGRKVEDYVAQGGTVVITFRSGYKEWDNQMSAQTIPGIFRNVTGVELWESDSLCFGRKVQIGGAYSGEASIWCDVLKSNGAEILSVYASEFYQGEAAITVNYFGKGKAYYVGCDLDENSLRVLLKGIAADAGVRPALEQVPEDVEVIRKVKDGKDLLFLINHSGEEKEIVLDGEYFNMLNDESMTHVHMDALGAIGLYQR